MAIDNEELMNDLQRVSAMLRRSRRARMKGRATDKEGNERVHDGSQACHAHHHHHHHRGTGFAMGEGDHGYGNHKCHGGSGRHGQNRILAVLVMQDGTTQKDLAYLLGIRPQSLTQALETLEENGFIERKQDEADHRSRRVHLTDKGRERAAKVAEDRKNYADDTLSMLSEEEKEQLSVILGKIFASLEADIAPRD